MTDGDAKRSVLLVGGHDTGKSTFVGRLWLALRRGDGCLAMPTDPQHIEYVETLVRELMQGKYPGRTDNDGETRDFEGRAVIQAEGWSGVPAHIVVPDVAGELWERASEERELDNKWIDRIRACSGALLFARFGSKHHVEALDWVTSAEKMKLPLAPKLKKDMVATQIFLTDMLNLLDQHLGRDTDLVHPRVSVIIAAWDALPLEAKEKGPRAFIDLQYPMFGGRLEDHGRLETRVFGISISGGDLNTAQHRNEFLERSAADEGFVVYQPENGDQVTYKDLTVPVAWALGVGQS